MVKDVQNEPQNTEDELHDSADQQETEGKEDVQDATEQLMQQVEEYKSKYLRAVADYQNLEKRMFEDRKETATREKANVINRLLPFLDNLDKAEMFIKDPGLKMIKDQFVQTMQELGIQEVQLQGTEFDPHVAEVIEVVDGEKDNIIVDVLRKAYSLNGKVIQHGQVRVSKKPVN